MGKLEICIKIINSQNQRVVRFKLQNDLNKYLILNQTS